MADDKDKSVLDNEAAGDARLSNHYRAVSNEQPARYLDDAILAASRKSVKSRPRPTGPLYFKWYVPVALAAVLVLSVSLVITMQDKGRIRQSPQPEYYDIKLIRKDEIKANETAVKPVSKAPAPLLQQIPPKMPVRSPNRLEEVIVTANKSESDLSQAPAPVTTIDTEDAIDSIRQNIQLRETADINPPRSSIKRPIQSIQVTTKDINQTPFIFDEEEIALISSNRATLADSQVTTLARYSRPPDTIDSSSPADMAMVTNQRPDNVLTTLAGQWSGHATTNANVQVPYDINFIIDPAGCVTGKADTGVSTHTWTFCDDNNLLKLEVLRNLNGTSTTVDFEESSQKADGIIFKANSIENLDIILSLSKAQSTLRIMQNDELRAEIQLKKIEE